MKSSKTIAVSIGILALIVGGFNTFTISDAEIQDYIKLALVKGCRPIIDTCDKNCKSIDLTKQGIKEECIPKDEIMRLSYERAQNNYIKLGEKEGIKSSSLQELPFKIRAELLKKSVVLEPLKEELSKQIK